MNSSLNLYPEEAESKGAVIITSQFVIGFSEHEIAWLSPLLDCQTYMGISSSHMNCRSFKGDSILEERDKAEQSHQRVLLRWSP